VSKEKIDFQRPQPVVLAERLAEPRRFVQVVAVRTKWASPNSILADLSTGLSASPSWPRFRCTENLKARTEFFSLREHCPIG
jgi:hypothetical protein